MTIAYSVISHDWWGHLYEDLVVELDAYTKIGSIQQYKIKKRKFGIKEITIVIRFDYVWLNFSLYINSFQYRGEFQNIEYGKRLFNGYHWTITEKTTAEEILLEIFSCFEQRKIEKIDENKIVERIRSYGFDNSHHAKKKHDETLGIDCYIVRHNTKVPLQLKMSIEGQNEHKKKYPFIPSLVYTNKNPNIYLERKCISKIFDNYVELGIIIHEKSILKTP
ncbi:MAG: hypothetical protein KBB88_00100 [Candidatus Pacebacteria bacterium]|nr:hypothetical protein [Candidatus Paceibacterota bacterium]